MEPQRINPAEVKRRLDTGEAVTFLDTRADEAWQKAETQIPHSIRVPPDSPDSPDSIDAHLDAIPKLGLIVPYCT